MRKSLLVLIGSAILVFALSSCVTVTSPVSESTPSITVTGQSEIKVKPDVAYFTVSYEVIKPTSEEASSSANEVINRASAILIDDFGLNEDDLETGYLSVGPYYEWVENERVLKGQRATQSIEVTDEKLDSLGALLSELSKIDGISVGSISLDKKDKSVERMEARSLSAQNALEKAEAYAKGVNAKIGRTLSIGNSSFSATPIYANKMMLTSAAMDTAESAPSSSGSFYVGDVTVSDSVTVVFELISE